jgi:hypothetical protein
VQLAITSDCSLDFISGTCECRFEGRIHLTLGIDECLQIISVLLPTSKANLATIDGLDEEVYTTNIGVEILKCTVRPGPAVSHTRF